MRKSQNILFNTSVCVCVCVHRSQNMSMFFLLVAGGWERGCNESRTANEKTETEQIQWKSVWQPPGLPTIPNLNFQQLRVTTPNEKNNNSSQRKLLQLSGHSKAYRPFDGWVSPCSEGLVGPFSQIPLLSIRAWALENRVLPAAQTEPEKVFQGWFFFFLFFFFAFKVTQTHIKYLFWHFSHLNIWKDGVETVK